MVIIFLVIYLLSAFGYYKFIQLAHYHPEGKWNRIEPHDTDKLAVFCPILNTFFCIAGWIHGWKKDSKSNFFKPKNK